MLLLCALIVGSVSGWAQTTLYSWNGNGSTTTANETGGTATEKPSASDNVKAGASQKGNYCLKLNKGYSSSGGPYYIEITLNGTLSTGDKVTIGAFRASTTNATLGVDFGTTATQQTKADTDVLTSNGTPSDWEITVPASANGGSTIRLYRSAGSTGLYVSKVVVTTAAPTIVASSVEYDADLTNGSIAYTISNSVDGGTLTAAKTTEADWLTVGTPTASAVPLTLVANTGAQRETTVRLTYTYDTNKTVTKDITVTQKAYIEKYAVTISAMTNGTVVPDVATAAAGATVTLTITPSSGYKLSSITATDADNDNVALSGSGNTRTFTMPAKAVTVSATFEENLSDDYVKVTDANTLRAGDQLIIVCEDYEVAMGTVSGSLHGSAGVTISSNVVSNPSASVAILTLGGSEGEWTLKSSITGDYLSESDYNNNLRENSTVDGDAQKWTISITEGDAKIINNGYPTRSATQSADRYIQYNYNGGNDRFAAYYSAMTSVSIYRLSKTVTVTAAEYATYRGPKALNFDGVGIKAFTAIDNETSVTLNEITSGKVPANTPVVLYKANGGTVNVPVIASADAPEGTNDLHVVGEGGLTGEDNIFVLSKTSGKDVGFYLWDKTKTLNAGKIYLQGKDSYGARSFLGFEEGNTTSIDVRSKMEDVRGEVYNLNGQRVAQPTKGLYIVNGKKVVVK